MRENEGSEIGEENVRRRERDTEKVVVEGDAKRAGVVIELSESRGLVPQTEGRKRTSDSTGPKIFIATVKKNIVLHFLCILEVLIFDHLLRGHFQ